MFRGVLKKSKSSPLAPLPLLPLTPSMTNITHSITSSTVDNTTAKSKNSKKKVKVWEMRTICTNKKGVTHTPLHTFQHPHHNNTIV